MRKDEREAAAERGSIILGKYAISYHRIASYTVDAIVDLLCSADESGADSTQIISEVIKKCELPHDMLKFWGACDEENGQ